MKFPLQLVLCMGLKNPNFRFYFSIFQGRQICLCTNPDKTLSLFTFQKLRFLHPFHQGTKGTTLKSLSHEQSNLSCLSAKKGKPILVPKRTTLSLPPSSWKLKSLAWFIGLLEHYWKLSCRPQHSYSKELSGKFPDDNFIFDPDKGLCFSTRVINHSWLFLGSCPLWERGGEWHNSV